MKNYTTKYLKLAHEIEETADLIEFPTYEFFADVEELGECVEITVSPWCCKEKHYTETRDGANSFYKFLIKDVGYKVVERVVS